MVLPELTIRQAMLLYSQNVRPPFFLRHDNVEERLQRAPRRGIYRAESPNLGAWGFGDYVALVPAQ